MPRTARMVIGQTLINCLAYIDLIPLRAGLVDRPEEYRWNSLFYHVQTNNRDNFLSRERKRQGHRGQSPRKGASQRF